MNFGFRLIGLLFLELTKGYAGSPKFDHPKGEPLESARAGFFKLFTGWTPFLLPHQQCQSTEQSDDSIEMVSCSLAM